MKRLLFALGAFILLSAPVAAATITGIWVTEPDAKAQTGHVQIMPCGAALCGTVVSAFDKAGKPITTASVGKRILRDLKPIGGNAFGDGKVYVPIMRSEFPVRMTVNGNRLSLRACNGLGICRSQTWTRVK